jgi:hypothetical protein
MRMKRLWLCIAATLVMVSCIRVDDFGKYWDKGVVDSALEGTWKNIRLPGSDTKPEKLRFTRRGSSYSMYLVYSDGDAPAHSARTLRVGKRKLLMTRSREGREEDYLWGYEIHGRTLSEYWFQSDAAVEFLEARHPGAKNIGRRGVPPIEIGTFDDEVFRILSEVADNPTYWTLMRRYEKVSN